MIISEFYKTFIDETSCKLHLRQIREEHGIICKKCGSNHHYWLKSKEQWQCKHCSFRTTLRSGTLFESSNLSLKTWYEALYLTSNTKKGVSACELQRLLGLNRYEPAWYMLQKIRKMMARINEQDQHNGDIELDNAFFTTIDKYSPVIPKLQNQSINSTRKQKAFIMAESNRPKNKKYIGKCGRIRILTVESLEEEIVWKLEEKTDELKPNTYFNQYRSNRVLHPYLHELDIILSSKSMIIYPWVHTAIGNIKRLIRGIYHHISSKFSQLYFDEFVFKFNYRHSNDRWSKVLGSSLNVQW